MNKQYGFLFDSNRCLKCWACEISCKQWHEIKAGTVKLRRLVEITSGSFPDLKRQFISLSCMHCSKPACVEACPTGALIKRNEDGIVLTDRNKCIGCHNCLNACPFGIPQYDDDGIMWKCDMCLDRIHSNQEPICAATCPTKALQWGTIEELSNLSASKGAVKLTTSRVVSNIIFIQ